MQEYTGQAGGDAKRKLRVMEFINTQLKSKENGYTRWGSDNWMKAPEYYQNLDTIALTDECFSGPHPALFGFEMGIYSADPLYGYYSLKIFHNGFAELFDREDFWLGLVHSIEFLSSKIKPEGDLTEFRSAAINLDHMVGFYTIDPVKDKIIGHEKELFTANYHALLNFQKCLDIHISQGRTTSEGLNFFGEPTRVSDIALLLARQIDPVKFARLEPDISNIRFSPEQIPAELKSYIDLVVERLKDFL